MFELNRLLNVIPFRTGTAADFQPMLDWKLLRGSHEFPGPDGGTCINEAAIVAAGYSYRAVHSIDDCPASFSRPIAMFALCLNDLLEDAPRQELLMPFVTRLDGTADSPKVEMARAEHDAAANRVDILAPALARAGFAEMAERCRVTDRARRVDRDRAAAAHPLHAPGVHLLLVAACDSAADAAQQWLAGRPSEVVRCLAHVIGDVATVMGDGLAAAGRDRASTKVFKRATAILDAVLEIGKRSDPDGAHAVTRRMEAAKRPGRRRGHREGTLVLVKG